jgi:hypothetical protein
MCEIEMSSQAALGRGGQGLRTRWLSAGPARSLVVGADLVSPGAPPSRHPQVIGLLLRASRQVAYGTGGSSELA